MGGAGARGIAYIGALAYLQEKKGWNVDQLHHLVGVSAGAMLGFFFMCGLKPSEVCDLCVWKDPLVSLNKEFSDHDNTQQFSLNVLASGGLLDTSLLKTMIMSVLSSINSINSNNSNIPLDKITFRQFYDTIRQVRFTVVTTCLTTETWELFDYIHTPHTNVLDAVVASCAIPLIFKPKLINEKLYTDGGVACPLPCFVIDSEKCTNVSIFLCSGKRYDGGDAPSPPPESPPFFDRMCKMYPQLGTLSSYINIPSIVKKIEGLWNPAPTSQSTKDASVLPSSSSSSSVKQSSVDNSSNRIKLDKLFFGFLDSNARGCIDSIKVCFYALPPHREKEKQILHETLTPVHRSMSSHTYFYFPIAHESHTLFTSAAHKKKLFSDGYMFIASYYLVHTELR